MRWQIRIEDGERRTLARLPKRLRGEIAEVLLDLRDEPRPAYSKPLTRELRGLRAIPIDGWRLIYSINEEDRIVIVVGIRPRGPNTYLNL